MEIDFLNAAGLLKKIICYYILCPAWSWYIINIWYWYDLYKKSTLQCKCLNFPTTYHMEHCIRINHNIIIIYIWQWRLEYLAHVIKPRPNMYNSSIFSIIEWSFKFTRSMYYWYQGWKINVLLISRMILYIWDEMWIRLKCWMHN